MTIEPIDKEFNQRLLDAEHLDDRLYSTKDLLQYYEISGFENTVPEIVQKHIDSFITANYNLENVVIPNQLTILFYKKELTADYGKHVYEAARETETGLIPDYNNNLLSRVQFSKAPGNDNKILRARIVYDNNTKLLVLHDTLELKKK